MKKNKVELFEHQEVIGDKIKSSFIFIHNDTFGREYETVEEILEDKPEGLECEVTAISRNICGINAFIFSIYDTKVYDDVSDLEEEYYYIECFDVIRYYKGTPFNYNEYKKEEIEEKELLGHRFIYKSFKEVYDLLPHNINYLEAGTVLYDKKYNMKIVMKEDIITFTLSYDRTYHMGIRTLDNLYYTLERALYEQKLRRRV